MSNTESLTPISKPLPKFLDIWRELSPIIPVLMQTAEKDFGAGNGLTKMQQVTDSIATILNIAAPMIMKASPHHAEAIAAATQGIFNILKLTGGLNFAKESVSIISSKD